MYSAFTNCVNNLKEDDINKRICLLWSFRGNCLYYELENELAKIKTDKRVSTELYCTRGYDKLQV